jgi:hypothetical protein
MRTPGYSVMAGDDVDARVAPHYLPCLIRAWGHRIQDLLSVDAEECDTCEVLMFGRRQGKGLRRRKDRHETVAEKTRNSSRKVQSIHEW